MSAQPEEQICMLDLEGMLLSERFEVRHRFRCGSFSELYLAHNVLPKPGEQENVVVKALNIRLRGAPGAELEKLLVEGFHREADALKQCEHKNIVRLIAYGAATDNVGHEFHYIVLEYLPSGNLKDLLQKGRVNLANALSLLSQISEALSCIHQKELVHRDIKPANVMVSADLQQAKLIDLGTVRWLDDNSQITEVGTPIYAAPEHYSSARAVGSLTVAADVYAFAKTSYALLTSNEPTGLNQQQIKNLPQPVQHEPWPAGVSSYRVYINDQTGDVVTRSDELPAEVTEWKLRQALKRGGIYVWTVVAVIDGKGVVSPGPSAPEMKFQVINKRSLDQLNQLKKTNSHLALGVFYANVGLTSEARQEFRKLVRLNPNSRLVSNLLRSTESQ